MKYALIVIQQERAKWCSLSEWPTGATAKELDIFIYEMLISVMIVPCSLIHKRKTICNFATHCKHFYLGHHFGFEVIKQLNTNNL